MIPLKTTKTETVLRLARNLLLAMALLAIQLPLTAAGATESQDYHLFVGLDLALRKGDTDYRIQGVERGSVRVVAAGATSRLALDAHIRVHTRREPVVSTGFVSLSHHQGRRVYSTIHEPTMEALQSQMLMDSLQADRQDRLVQAEIGATEAAGAAARADPLTRAALSRAAQTASARSDAARQSAGVNFDQGQKALADRAAPEAGRFDAFEVTFEIAATEPYSEAYVVLLTTVRDPQNPRVPIEMVELRELPPIGSTPKKIRVLQAGLPIGFGVDAFEIHVYVEGRELATNLAENRVELTRAETYQFLLLQHTLAHQRQTVPPVPVPELLSRDLRAQIVQFDPDRRVDVTVDREGKVVDVALEGAGSSAADAEIGALIRELRFFPALVAGEASSGSTVIVLRHLLQ